MDSNTPEIEKSIGRYIPHKAPPTRPRTTSTRQETCRIDGCDASVSIRIAEEDGTSVEIRRCAKGHFQRERLLDVDGAAYRTFHAILGP